MPGELAGVLSFAYLSLSSTHQCSPNLAHTPSPPHHPFAPSQGKLLKLATGSGVIEALIHPTVWIAFQLQQ